MGRSGCQRQRHLRSRQCPRFPRFQRQVRRQGYQRQCLPDRRRPTASHIDSAGNTKGLIPSARRDAPGPLRTAEPTTSRSPSIPAAATSSCWTQAFTSSTSPWIRSLCGGSSRGLKACPSPSNSPTATLATNLWAIRPQAIVRAENAPRGPLFHPRRYHPAPTPAWRCATP